MPKFEQPPTEHAAPEELLPRPQHGHQPAETGPLDAMRPRSEIADPHPDWLKTWRSLRAECRGNRTSDAFGGQIRELQTKIAHTPAVTLAGLQAQAELISELAWNDVVAATARKLIAGLKRLQRPGRGG